MVGVRYGFKFSDYVPRPTTARAYPRYCPEADSHHGYSAASLALRRNRLRYGFARFLKFSAIRVAVLADLDELTLVNYRLGRIFWV